MIELIVNNRCAYYMIIIVNVTSGVVVKKIQGGRSTFFEKDSSIIDYIEYIGHLYYSETEIFKIDQLFDIVLKMALTFQDSKGTASPLDILKWDGVPHVPFRQQNVNNKIK